MTIVLLSVLPLLAIFYGIGSYFLVPFMIKSVLVSNLEKQFDRPVELGRVVFSPFKLVLLVDDLTVGALRGDTSGTELFRSEKVRFGFSLARLFNGKLVCRKAELDGFTLHVVRDKDKTYDMQVVSDMFLSGFASGDAAYWPSWLVMDETMIKDGQVHVDDRVAKKVFTIEQIRFYLPSAEKRNLDRDALPKLSAVIESSPVEVNAVRFQDQSGAWRTGFSFEFRKVIVPHFRELLPLPATGMELAEGEADINLNVILPENLNAADGITVEGEADLRDARWNDPESQVALSLPESRIMFKVSPAAKLVRLTSVEFHEPELLLEKTKEGRSRNPLASYGYIYSLLTKTAAAEEPLEVESFLLNNGKLVMEGGGPDGGSLVLSDVMFKMTGFATAGHRKIYPATADTADITFRAKDISAKPGMEIISEGRLRADKGMNGRLEMKGFDVARYPGLFPVSSLSLRKGRTDVAMQYEYGVGTGAEKGQAVVRSKIFSGTFKTTGFVLEMDGIKVASGDTMSCVDFFLDMASRTVVCDKLELLNSDVLAGPFLAGGRDRQEVKKGSWSYRFNNLKVGGSMIRIPLAGASDTQKSDLLTLEKVKLEGTSLHSEKVAENIKATAVAGKGGKLTVNGGYSAKTGYGEMQLGIENIDLSLLRPYLSPWLVPNLNKGSLTAAGSLKLPEKEFKGKIRVEGFDAGEGSGPRITWKDAAAESCSYHHAPFSLSLPELVIQHPAVEPGLSSGDSLLRRYVRLEGDVPPPSVRIGRIRFEDAAFTLSEPVVYPGYQPLLQGMKGTFSLAGTGNHGFEISGMIGGQATFKLQGASTLSSVRLYELGMKEFSLAPFDSVLRKGAGLKGNQAFASWKQILFVDQGLSKVSTRLTLRDIEPDPASDAAATLSLLINEDNAIEMDIDGEYKTGTSRPFLLEQFVNRVRHLAVKTAISPRLVLKSVLPEIELPENVAFDPGSEQMTEDGTQLAGYRELLRKRPYVRLSLQGEYDPVVDRETIQAALQEKADAELEEENSRRALEKVRILQQQQRRAKELKDQPPGVIVEEIPPGELTGDLDPLPRVIMEVDPAVLEELARKRAQVLRDHIVNRLQVDPARLEIAGKSTEGKAGVLIGIKTATASRK